MSLVMALIVLGGSAGLVWSGITDPEGGAFAGIGRLMRGETQPDRQVASFTATIAALTAGKTAGGTGAGAGGGKPSTGTMPTAHTGATTAPPPPAGKAPKSVYNLGPVKPHVARAANELGPLFLITSIGGWRASATDPAGHPAGLALDFMCSDVPRGSSLAAYALANRGRLGVLYVIWRQRINSGDGRGWRAMEDRGSPTANHMDHVHVSFNPTAGGVST